MLHIIKLKLTSFWFNRIKVKQAISFIKGLLSPSHLKCKQPRFEEGMHEAKMQVPLALIWQSAFLFFQYMLHEQLDQSCLPDVS